MGIRWHVPIEGAADNVDCGVFCGQPMIAPTNCTASSKKWCCGRFFDLDVDYSLRRFIQSVFHCSSAVFSENSANTINAKFIKFTQCRKQVFAYFYLYFRRKHHCFIIHCTVHCKHSRYFPRSVQEVPLSYSAPRLFPPQQRLLPH